jgi:hypothetical protein
MSCKEFLAIPTYTNVIEIEAWNAQLFPAEKGLKITTINSGIKDTCERLMAAYEARRVEAAKAEARQRAETDAAEARDQAANIARRRATFRNGVVAAWQASSEQDAFASIRGNYDLSVFVSGYVD